MFHLIFYYYLRSLFFNRKGVDLDGKGHGEDLERVKAEETIVILCEEIIHFNKRKQQNNSKIKLQIKILKKRTLDAFQKIWV